MQRIARGHSATLTHTFYVDGVATDPAPDSATVTITADDGTVLVAAQVATNTGTGTVSYTLTPTHTALLDVLTVQWTATFGTQSQVFTDYVEIVGGFLFSIAEARALAPLNSTTSYPVARIIDVRTVAEQAIEDACGVAFVPRFARELLSGTQTRKLIVTQPRVRVLRFVRRDGVAFAVGELATVRADDAGILDHPGGWIWGAENYEVAYEHGYTYPPGRIKQAALTLARSWLVDGPMDERTTAFTTPDGTFTLSTPGLRGAVFGIPEVDAAINAYDERAMVA